MKCPPGPNRTGRGDPATKPPAHCRGRAKEEATTQPTRPNRPGASRWHRRTRTRRATPPATPPTAPTTPTAPTRATGASAPPLLPQATALPTSAPPRRGRSVVRKVAWGVAIISVLLVAAAPPAAAASAPSLSGVVSNLTNWIVGILAGVATLFLTLGGLRYVTAGGDPGQVEKAKTALKSAAIGYALAILAPLLVSIVTSIVS